MNAVTEIPTGQQMLDYAAENGFPQRTLLQVVEALHSPDPVKSVEWLLSVEEDETARAGFQAALDVLRNRDPQSATCVRCDVDLDFAPADAPAPDMPGRRVCATEAGEIGETACGISDLQLAVARHIREAGRSVAPDQAAEWQAALAAALPLLDAAAEALTAFTIRDETAWLAITNHMLAKVAERAPAPGGAE